MKKIAVLAVFAMATVAFGQVGIGTDPVNYNSGTPTGGEFVTSFGAEGGPTALLYNDRPAGHGGIGQAGMELALNRLGYTVTFTNSGVAFAGLISPSFKVVVSGHHNEGASAFDAQLQGYVSGGGAAVVEDWRTMGGPVPSPTYPGAWGLTAPVMPQNYTGVTPAAGSRLLSELGPGAIPLFNSQWGIFNNSISAGGTTELNSNVGSRAGVSHSLGGATKNLFYSGLNDDTIGAGGWDPALAQDLYSAMITNVPEPTTVMLLGLGALGILRRRR
jgi:hypothetical protein